ncbi:MAG: mechanosensitive ion channel family protein [Anaerolineae bacterium]|nr:mechanosensitive ion channel family protein [Thermoflexales bacterium]MDW8407101.1 mechanosensitive ion channel family protein [Anaerolineae bacterium]
MSFEELIERLLNPENLIGALTYAAVTFGLAALLVRVFQRIMRRLLERETRLVNRTTLQFVSQLGQVAIVVFAVVLYANLIPSLRAIGTALVTSVSIASLVVGLAAQNTLGNLIAGIALALYRPFEIGDLVQVNAPSGLEIGHIESLTLGYTVLRTWDNRRVIVPNSVMNSQITINLSAHDPRKLAVITFQVGAGADLDQARSMALQAAQAHPLSEQVVGCPVINLSAGNAVLSLRVWCAHFEAAKKLEFDLYEAIKKQFHSAGIPLA